jgi:hypothetical protein
VVVRKARLKKRPVAQKNVSKKLKNARMVRRIAKNVPPTLDARHAKKKIN